MGRGIVKNLQDLLRDVERDIEERTKQIDRLNSYAQTLRQMLAFYAPQDGDEAAGAELPARTVRETGTPRVARQQTKEVRNALVEILRDAGGPMHSVDLLAALGDRGVEVRGSDPANNVRSHLSHDIRFVSVGRGHWDLASRVNADRAGQTARLFDPRAAHSAPPEASPEEPPDDPTPEKPAEDWGAAADWTASHATEEELATVPF